MAFLLLIVFTIVFSVSSFVGGLTWFSLIASVALAVGVAALVLSLFMRLSSRDDGYFAVFIVGLILSILGIGLRLI